MDILIYKGGISNNGAIDFLNKNKIKYDTIPIKQRYDYIVKPPGVLKEEITIEGKIICDIELIYMLKEPFIVGITGSAGKTTTTMLVNEILKHKYSVKIAGNIGVPFGDAYEDNNSIYVLELSSFELDSCISLKPRISILLNISNAHLDYHKTMSNYIEAKRKITSNQNEYDFLIYNYDDLIVRGIAGESRAIKRSFSLINKKADAYFFKNRIITNNHNYFLKDEIIKFEGDICNAMAAILVGELTGVDYNKIEKTINNMEKPKYRMEQIFPNVYNDAKSTNILSTLKQIKSFRNVQLICGGYDRGNNLDMMKELFPYVEKFYLYGANSKRVASFLDEHHIPYHLFDTLRDASKEALASSKTVILSPMAPSYDQYSSYAERGEEFERLAIENKKMVQ